MKRCHARPSTAPLALTALALLGLPLPGNAQQSLVQTLVPFKASAVVTTDSIMIPLTPPIVPTRVTYSSGQSDLLGPFTGIANQITHLNTDGTRLSITDGIGAWTAANGDSIFLSYSGMYPPSNSPDVILFQKAVAITGGTGRFVGASGSGTINGVVDVVKKQITMTFEGKITAPKP
jgi:hypothetical protein